MKRAFIKILPFALLLCLSCIAGQEVFAAEVGEIGQAAKARSELAPEPGTELTQDDVDSKVMWIKLLGALLFGLVLMLVDRVAKMVGWEPFKNIKSNYWTPRIYVLVHLVLAVLMVTSFVGTLDYFLPESASEHGLDIDRLFLITTIITGIAFIAVVFVNVLFIWQYRSRPGTKALYYPDNHKLELLWTAIPAVGLAAMIIPGLKYWSNYSYPENDPKQVNIEIMAEQFNWTAHYAGPDNKFGRYDFRQVDVANGNALGLDSLDKNREDDIIVPGEVHIPKGYQVTFKVRSKDVLHGFYFPHFRANVYAIPGLPTSLTFKPRFTTAEAREQYENPEFDYVVACSQICGGSHYKMQMKVIVDSPEEYNEWLASKESWMKPAEAEETPADDPSAPAEAADQAADAVMASSQTPNK